MLSKIKQHKLFVVMLAILAACGIVIAEQDWSGEANTATIDAGAQGYNSEIATTDMLKPSAKNPGDPKQEAKLNAAIKSVNDEYAKLVEKAKSEIDATGVASDATRKAGVASAEKYNAASEKLAAYYDGIGEKSRANVARTAGETRLANADMTFYKIDADKIAAYNEKQQALADARKAYVEDAKNDLSAEDKAAIKADLTPRVTALAEQAQGLVSSVTNLLSQIKDQITAGGIGGLTSCAKSAAESDNPVQSLLSPVTSLLDMAQSLLSNVQSFSSDLASL